MPETGTGCVKYVHSSLISKIFEKNIIIKYLKSFYLFVSNFFFICTSYRNNSFFFISVIIFGQLLMQRYLAIITCNTTSDTRTYREKVLWEQVQHIYVKWYHADAKFVLLKTNSHRQFISACLIDKSETEI